jgi:hypothetical protein
MWRTSAGRRWSKLSGVEVEVRDGEDIVAKVVSREWASGLR